MPFVNFTWGKMKGAADSRNLVTRLRNCDIFQINGFRKNFSVTNFILLLLMSSEFVCRLVLLDFGHPMTTDSMNNIVNSLENILALKLTFSRSTKQSFGISILNSDFGLFQTESDLRKNYQVLCKNLQAFVKAIKLNSRVTVQEYKQSLRDSIEDVLCEFQKFKKPDVDCCRSEISVALITKKTASVLAAILKDVMGKLQRNVPFVDLIKSYKIIQVLNEHEKISEASDKDIPIDWISCPDNIYDLGCFFKEWFLHRQREMRIMLSKELEVKCDVHDCMVNPFSTTFDLFNDVRGNGSDGSSTPAQELKITNRVPLSIFCPTFGIPRRVCPTQSSNLTRTESQFNSIIFKNLCRELHRTGEGLLATTERRELRVYHFLTSDGDGLLVRDVAPEELYLPSGPCTGEADSGDDETAASLIRACFEKIKLLNEYSPENFSSGCCDSFRSYLVRRVGKSEGGDRLAGDHFESRGKRRQKSGGAEVERGKVHPALLSPNVVEKYRKIHSNAFHLPELGKDYNDN